ncbi:sushi domain-containing protein 1 [Gouania willdenowi]|uniref:sushi domain-containing protein 1 n=1 Tax=Gouania willdenowi TaxID=441366 RepID=UPI001056D681|nr:sushi domain-containing protein 1-like [Gouania willdenowi]
MDGRNISMMVLLVCVFTGEPTQGQPPLDVCASCHTNATCDDKSDGSGKVCNCKYGFVGNGRSFCQDKDECQIGATKICGPHTTCHNTYGSYFCTCWDGYSPSNNMELFIPNDGTHCTDIDECGILEVCGEGARCRNLDGSFDCSCEVGYRVHDGPEPFNPIRDKSSCQVADCGHPVSVPGAALTSLTGTMFGSVALFVCDDEFVWRSGDNRSVCGADGQWEGSAMVCEEVDCGPPPAQPHSHMLWDKRSRMGDQVVYECTSGYQNVGLGNISICAASGLWEKPSVLCREILCGVPPVIEFTDKKWDGNSSAGSLVLYYCQEGLRYKGGENRSICTENGQWTTPTLSCGEVLCGSPPVMPHTGHLWNGSLTSGSSVTYYCNVGFNQSAGHGVSVCTENGYWTHTDIVCTEVTCGEPKHILDSVLLWDQTSSVGSQLIYQCKPGFMSVGEGNRSVCTSKGQWEGASLRCQEITCGEPLFKPNTKIRWDGTSHVGSVAYYQCEDTFHTRSLRNLTVCREDGLWEDIDLWCEEVTCGPPITLPNTKLQWERTSTPGSVALYECEDGFFTESDGNISTCSLSGEWGEVTVNCKAICGPIPQLLNSEVVWHNRSLVIHRCIVGFHSWRGTNVSVCGSSGVWEKASLRCIEIKPPVNHLSIFNEKCLSWRAEKFEEDTEVYQVTYSGSRDYQRSFHSRRKRFMSSKADMLELCLDLLPVTNYSITVTATTARFTASISINTSLPVPLAPVVHYQEFETPLPRLKLRRSPNTMDLLSLYQVFVLHVDGIMTFDCSSPASLSYSNKHKPSEYIAAQFELQHAGTRMNFTVGDGLFYGGFYNAPLERGGIYYIIIRAVSQWKNVGKSSCVLWAKVKGTSYILKVSSLFAAATIGTAVLMAFGGYSLFWCLKKA